MTGSARTLVGMLTAVATCFALVSCTPKPVEAAPVAEDFLEALAARDTENIGELIDIPATAQSVINSTWDGLQAESLTATLGDVDVRENIATAQYTLDWQLPRERSLTYDTALTLTKTGEEWTVRWQPTLLHPSLGANQHLELHPVTAERASVVSSDGVEILQPGTMWRVLVDTDQVDDVRPVAASIAASVNAAHGRDETVPLIDAAELTEQLDRASGIYSVTMVNQVEGARVAEELAGVAGVIVNDEAAMVNLDPGFAPDIMARVSTIVAEDLDGANGWRVTAVNEHGSPIDDVEYHPAQPAPAIRIGLDHDIQRAAQEAVDLRANSQAMLVAIRPSTGQVLAVAQTKAADEKGDVALSGLYPPGSVFKIITAAAGLDRQGLNTGSIVPCPGSMNLYGRVVINYNQFALGNVPLERAFASSCNTTFADISTNLAPGELTETAKQFGLGVDYDIPGLHTVTGSVPVGETPLDRTEAGYGQGLDLASPFGLALVAATAANGSTPLPVLIEGHETTASEEVPAPEPEVIDQVRQMMRSVVTSGTARGMQASGALYGKTGEAEINEGSHAWFAGYRDDDIAFATLVVLGGGSETATAITDRFFLNLDGMRADRVPVMAG
ncbi:penicillin-binding transpeptidase domain-containing protein [Corynebacterium sp. YIM 101645]|uniref:Penicillin-binding transpeptidase domain-containing protein n=1 Tax=Corynebacterium lemuris TaxID=1859292 RepID=A0ABT2FVG9_9CORY|nr:penicillin-binding transpeptidase domain-containing protein [Corynebacterium lemuris]MCS5479237.1 penicillin-binding transpeptidase domain-containing protein [Corynebacterium lemuris]